MAPEYAELHCLSNFSFQRGASSALELFERAKECGYQALAITDECSLAGIVRALEASRKTGVALIVGAEFQLEDGPKVVLLCASKEGYVGLCALITRGRRAAEKGEYRIHRQDFGGGLPGTIALWVPRQEIEEEEGRWLKEAFGDRLRLAVELHMGPDDAQRLRALELTGQHLQIPLVASGDVHMHVRRRRALQDVLTAIRHRRTVPEAGGLIFPNGERHLRAREALATVYPPELLAESLRIAEQCRFSLEELSYKYPAELVPDGHTPMSWLKELTEEGARRRWPGGLSAKVRAQIDHEYDLIAQLKYEPYFLTVHEIVDFARGRGILCQGRGSAANSAVCFALGVTEVDPNVNNLLVERFMSIERNEPPDIDIDFEHERREEVFQHIYQKYGRDRAALAATVISYRGKSAVRDVARALALPLDQIDLLSKVFAWWDGEENLDAQLRERGFDPDSPLLKRVVYLTREILDSPRHLSQHVGGFVISDMPLSHLVPVENAAMPDRTIIQWDKDDLDTMGLLKVDCLALGMLTCVQKCLDLLLAHHGRALSMASISQDQDDATYEMIQRADTVGVFQIESRAQMAMLPRHRPRNFYDLVIQVAIVRPGPIQGDMIHPYLRRRRGEEEITYPSEELKAVFERTLGVPLFQEQVMKLAMVAAGYSAGEADQLRRAMAAWKRHGGLEAHRERLMTGMRDNGFSQDYCDKLFEQIKGFGSYGFPESHAASFAHIAYVSCWLKCHYPAEFLCALLNSQPMGFYAPSQLVQDGQRHGIVMRPVDVRHSEWDNTLESDRSSTGGFAIRLGFRQVRGFREDMAERIVSARDAKRFTDIADLCGRAAIDSRHRDLLADAGALRGLAGHRHRARWAIAGVEAQLPLFGNTSPEEEHASIPAPSQGENTLADYAHVGLTLGPHPIQLIRDQLRAVRCIDSRTLAAKPNASFVRAAGLVTQRQRPQTASGVTFITLEDEFGPINVVVWRDVAEMHKRVYLEAKLLGVIGRWEHQDGVSHLIAARLLDYTEMLGNLDARSRDFH
ncbi:error-prone DNA polymerase (plasmid) [Dyella sp. BiH032]|uniref:error-prone DNA polymerase n=1 Tax=Dyella sp. BiH032 TaxID=3075430 RepID=UPI002892A3E4|nr:error-prone DNA polymerase [Dyella sp. BiH032]WNL48363.1 error-prone DNA polymerase [Dyella sp. BiH032]